MRKGYFFILIFLSGCGVSHYHSGGKKFSKTTKSPKRATSRPYRIKGIQYHPQSFYEYEEVGLASHYGDNDGFHGKKTSTGEVFDTYSLTAAHKTLPLPSVVEVINLENGRRLKLRVNDRGPFVRGRIIDVSKKASLLLGFYKKGVARVRVRALVSESQALNMGKKPYKSHTRLYPIKASRVVPAAIQRSRPSRPSSRPVPIPAKKPFMKVKHGSLTTQVPMDPIYIQAATFQSYDNAYALVSRITKRLKVKARLHPIQQGKLYKVTVGPFPSRLSAKSMLPRIETFGCPNPQVIDSAL